MTTNTISQQYYSLNNSKKTPDKFGFSPDYALLDMSTNTITVLFKTKTPRNNLIIQKNRLTGRKEAVFSFEYPNFTYEHLSEKAQQLLQLDLLDAIIESLHNITEEKAIMTFANVPTCVFEDQQAVKKIIDALPKNNLVLTNCESVLHDKLDLLKAAKQNTRSKTSRAESKKSLYSAYTEQINK